MSKILLDSTPNIVGNKCPFIQLRYGGSWECGISHKECCCTGGYCDSYSFDFDRCPYCKVNINRY